MISEEYRKAFSQVLYVIECMEPALKNRIPLKVINALKENASEESSTVFEKVENINLSSKACSVLAIIYLNCLCSQEEKVEYINLLKKNDEIYKNIENEKIDGEEIFSNNTQQIEYKCQENSNMVEYKKENIFNRFFNRIKNLFKKDRR